MKTFQIVNLTKPHQPYPIQADRVEINHASSVATFYNADGSWVAFARLSEGDVIDATPTTPAS